MNTQEETRAAAYRAQAARRVAAVTAAEKRLSGRPDLKRDLLENWEPILNRNLSSDDHRTT